MNKKPFHITTLLLFLIIVSCVKKVQIHELNPEKNSRIVFLGNTFAVALQENNYFETLLYESFPDRNLTVRNLGWSADEVNSQPRPLGFGTLDLHLQQQKADIIFACFGLNEAFDGPDSLDHFLNDLKGFVGHMQEQKYNGRSVPQVILVSPIAHEKLGGLLPDPVAHNENLELYTEGMRKIANELGIPFIDLFKPTAKLVEVESDSLTFNGIHLNDNGYIKVSEIMAKAMGFPVSSWIPDVHANNLRKVIAIKNKHFFYKFNAGNAEYIVGRRKEWAGGEQLQSELLEIDSIVQCLDSVIWSGNRSLHLDMNKVNNLTNYSNGYKPLDNSQKLLDEELSQFVLQDGFEINLFASEVEFPIANPVAITFDPRGRMWVATMPSYPHYYPGDPPDDKIVILEDSNLDGKADKHTVFADSLYLPLGFELGDGGVYVTQAPDLVFLKDTDGDGRADLKKTLLTGFGTEDSHHAISAYTWGPDGALYMHDGTFLHSQIETPYGPKRGAYGTTWRYEPQTMKLDPYISYFYANPWGNVFTRNGTHLIADVSTGMNYFAPPLTVAIDYPKKHKEMKDFLTISARPKTCGMEIVSSRQFPESAQGNILFNTFIGFQGIKQHKLSEDGSGIIAHETTPLLQSKDRNFRPVDLKFGPDGALYVVDWYDPIIQHGEQNFRDPLRDHTRGRIWRITYKKNKALKPVDLSRLSIGDLLDQLKVFEDRTRYRTRIQLREFPVAEVVPALEKWISSLDPADANYEYHKLEGLWVYQQFNHPMEQLLSDLLKSNDYNVRAAATRVLFYWKEQIKDADKKLIKMCQDPSARVRLEAIVALSHYNTEASVNALLAATELPIDDYIDYALEESFKQLKPVWMQMFKRDNEFLADDPDKARRLFKPFMSQKELAGPNYFVQDDPQGQMYSFQAFSEEEYQALSTASAFVNFSKTFSHSHSQIEPEASSQTPSKSNLGEIVVTLAAIPGKMLFDKSAITIPAGKSISLIFENRDQMPHNVVIVTPGSIEKVGNAADDMASLKDGYEKNFVPRMPEVLFATPLVAAGKTFQLDFKAPDAPGRYPFICSFPGHWRVMKGVINVTSDATSIE